jgi:hypothetical protein
MSNKKKERKQCDKPFFHGPHGRHGDDDADIYQLCGGKYRINREDFEKPAVVKAPYLMSKSGKLIHKASRTSGDAWFMWRPERHAWGWRYNGDGDPDLYVRTRCKYPRIIDNPILLDETHLQEAVDSRVGSTVNPHELCKRCFA